MNTKQWFKIIEVGIEFEKNQSSLCFCFVLIQANSGIIYSKLTGIKNMLRFQYNHVNEGW